MVTHWSNAFSYRERVTVGTDPAGSTSMVLPQTILDAVGAKEGDEFSCLVTPDGSIRLRKIEG